MKTKNTIVVALLLGGFSLAFAQTPFTSFDSNNDGIISGNEFTKTQAKNMEQRATEGRMMKNAGNAPSFSDVDLNKDGKVTKQEHQQFQAQRMQQNREKKMNNKNQPKKYGYGQNKGQGKGQGMGKGRGAGK